MGLVKSELFKSKQNDLAVLFKALGHPARIAIIEYLLKVDSCICNDIVNELPLAQPTISQHLRELKSAGIIKGTVEGTSICYCVDPKVIKQLQIYFNTVESRLENQKQNCC